MAGSDRWDPGSFHSGGPYSLHRPHHQREYTRAQTKNPFGAVCCTHWLHKNCFAPDMFTYKLLARRTECALTRGICTRGLPFVSQLFAPEIWEAEACSLFPIYLQHQKPHEESSLNPALIRSTTFDSFFRWKTGREGHQPSSVHWSILTRICLLLSD